jgi:outer membrane protein assembly factor BamD (BamD/ComL family)
MGRERNGTRQYLYFCAAGLIMVMLNACPSARTVPAAGESRAHLQHVEQEGGSQAHLQHVQHLIDQGDFEGALRENQQVFDLFPQSPPGDAALFNMGLIHVHYANPKRDFKEALGFFARLEKEFPKSARMEDAKIWTSVLETMEIKTEKESRTHQLRVQLQRVHQFIAQGDFESALRENQQVLSLSPKKPPGDTALFYMGLIHVHYANPKKDVGKALSSFVQLAKEFPGSQHSEEAKIWAGILETMEKTRQIHIEIEEKKKELRR